MEMASQRNSVTECIRVLGTKMGCESRVNAPDADSEIVKDAVHIRE